MKRSPPLSHTKQEATRATGIVGIIFNHFTRDHNMLYFGGGYRAIRVGHLANRMGQKA